MRTAHISRTAFLCLALVVTPGVTGGAENKWELYYEGERPRSFGCKAPSLNYRAKLTIYGKEGMPHVAFVYEPSEKFKATSGIVKMTPGARGHLGKWTFNPTRDYLPGTGTWDSNSSTMTFDVQGCGKVTWRLCRRGPTGSNCG